MSKYFMFGEYSSNSVKNISGDRTRQAHDLIERLGGKVVEIYALMGEYDLVLIVELPNMGQAMKAAVSLGRETGITFSTAAAIPIEEFDEMVDGLA